MAGPTGAGNDRRDEGGREESAAERIRAARRSRGLTQDQLAQAMGVSRSAVAQWETGRSGYNGKLRQIAEALDVPTRQLQPGNLYPLSASSLEAVPVSPDEAMLLRRFRELDMDDQECLLRVARGLGLA